MTDRHDTDETWIGPVGEACPIPAPGWEDHEPCGCLPARRTTPPEPLTRGVERGVEVPGKPTDPVATNPDDPTDDPTVDPAPADATVGLEVEPGPARTLVVYGAKGGQGASTVAAAVAVLAARHTPTTLVTPDVAGMAALLGLPRTAVESLPATVTPGLCLSTGAEPGTGLAVLDAQTARHAAQAPEGVERYAVLRGPCYLALAALLAAPGPPPDAVVVIVEPGRSLTARDAAEVLGVPIAAELALSPAVGRAIDAGVLTARLPRLRDLAPVAALTDPTTPLTPSRPRPRPPLSTPTRFPYDRTDLPLAQWRKGHPPRARQPGVANGAANRTYTRHGLRNGEPRVLNIGRLAPGAADYYIGEVATSAEDYYTGRGEAQGRWVGSLAPELGLTDTVAPEHFRALLAGQHPLTGEALVARARRSTDRCPHRPAPNQAGLFDDDALEVPQVAARLRVSVQRVRELLSTGAKAAAKGEQPAGDGYLRGERVTLPGRRGPAVWLVPRGEVERYEHTRQAQRARPGYDLALRPPKSVSVLWALAEPDRQTAIRQAHRDAVDAVVAYYEANATFARRGTGDRGRIETDGLVAAAFDHRTSRAGDPLLHTHVVTANLTRTAEGRWQALDGRALYEHARTAGFLYQAQLRHELTRTLGVSFGAVRNGYAEVDGIPTEVLRTFSKRRDEIEQVVAESGYTTARAHQTATLATRAAKDYGVDAATLTDRWRTEAAELGFGPDDLAACFDRAAIPTEPATEKVFEWLAGPAGLTYQASTFTRSDVVRALAEHLGAAATATRIEALADEFLASPHATPLAPSNEPGAGDLLWRRIGRRRRDPALAVYSTPELLDLEATLLRWATRGFDHPTRESRTVDPDVVEAVLARHPELTDEQTAMVRSLCATPAAIQPVAGRPGSGKTYATAACVEAWTASGVPVVGCALAATAAAELEAATHLAEHTGRPASTIARLLGDIDRHVLPHGTVILVDEASMVGTRDLARLAAAANRAGGTVKLIGDPDQHGPVETGGLFRRLLAERADIAVHLVANNRQDDPDERAATVELRHELVHAALARYDAAGKIVRSPTAAASYDAMVTDWLHGVRAGHTDPMIAGPNRVRRALNLRARAHLDAAGDLTGPALDAAGRRFQTGDWVIARRNAYHLTNPDTGGAVKNGRPGAITAVDPHTRTVTVDFDVDGPITLPADYLDAGHLDYGYARTTYSVQGATLHRALYHPGDASSFEEGYVALTRGRTQARIYLVDGTTTPEPDLTHRGHDQPATGLDTIAEALSRRRSRTLALDTDPTAAATTRYDGWTLAQLATERHRLEATLAAGPPSVAPAHTATSRERDQHLTRRQAWAERARTAQQQLDAPGTLLRPRARRVAAAALADAERHLTGIDRSIARLDDRLATLQEAHDRHTAHLDTHADVVERLELIGRAELARELKVRATARLAPDTAAPASPVERQLTRAAAEEIAVHLDRHGRHDCPDPDGADGADDPITQALGVRPADRDARRSYDRAAAALRAALELPDPRRPEVDLPAPV